METLKELFFESPFYVYVTLALAELVIAAIWYERRTPGTARLLLAPLLLAGAVFVVERMVVTDRERIIDISEQIARDLEAGNVDAAMTHIDDNFVAGFIPFSNVMGKSAAKKAATALGTITIRQHKPSKITLSDFKVDVRGNNAAMEVRSVISFAEGEAKGYTASFRWTLHWVKNGDEWFIDEAAYKMGI